ncbi:MAG: hypothetical protein HKP32_08235 [Woeseia sp.]|nr:hypothetical protein [Woeseia sp.]NNL55126.1 hypothetical protein [Woeseia sp.]
MQIPKLLVLLALCFLVPGRAAAEAFELDVVETQDLRLLYLDPFQTHLAPYVIRNFQNSLEFQRRIFDWNPREKSTVVLTDLSDYGNAGAGASPSNGVSIFIAPASRTLETMPSSERIFMIMNHEMVHVANMDVSNRQDRRWRRLFGGKPRQTDRHPLSILYNYLTVPRLSAPRWYLEGAATFMETWMSGGIGRAQGAYDEMVFRSMVRDDAYFYSDLGIVSEGVTVDFQAGVNAYLYGTRFISYLAYEYSPQHVIDWLKRGEDSERYYARQFEKVFGKKLETVWNDWIDFEHRFQEANLAAVREYPLTPVAPLSKEPLGSISRSYIDEERQELIGAFRYPGVVAHVGVLSLKDGKLRRVVDIKGPMTYRVTSSAWDPASRTFFYTADNLSYRDVMAVNIDTGKEQMLLKDARIGDLVFNAADKSLWGLRHLNGYVSLVRIPYPYKEWNLVHQWPYGEVAYELDLSADGEYLSASLGEIDGAQHLKVFRTADLLEGNSEAFRSFNFSPAVPEGFVFSPDGRYLYGSSFYTGVSNIFRYEIENGEIEALSNAETGFFRPQPLDDGRILVFEYTGQGFVPGLIKAEPLEDVSSITFLGNEIAKKHPVVRDWNVAGSLADFDDQALVTHRGKYRPYRELELQNSFPVLEGYRSTEALGWRFQFSDPAQFHKFNATASYSVNGDLPNSENLHVELEYQALNWHAKYRHNGADFYDLFGPTKRSRKGDAWILGYDKAIIYDKPRQLDFSGSLAYYTGLNVLPANQNVSTAAIEHILALDVGLEYTNTRSSVGAVEHEKGIQWGLSVGATDSDLGRVYKPQADFDFGFALPWKHASLWFYNSGGISDGDINNPLSGYYFGGFGNNYVDDGVVKRFRQYSSLPGFEIDEIRASDWVKSVAEFNLPPWRFREVGTPGFFLSHIRPTLFYSALIADPGDTLERTVTALGAQLDLKFTIVHRLPMTLSVGYAAGFDEGRRRGDEWMLSLKIL